MPDARMMKLKVVSNVDEVGTHVFENIPVDSTLGWIKQHLQSTLPSHPPVETQRILWQARFLDNDNATLAQIFGDPVPHEQAFHLVLKAPRASRLNPSDPMPRTASAPPDASRASPSTAEQSGPPRPRTQVQGAVVNPPHIELNISNIGQQIQQALDQAQTQLHQAGFRHIRIPQVGTAIQTAAQNEIDGALSAAGLQGNRSGGGTAATPISDFANPSVTVSQQPPSLQAQSVGPPQPPSIHAPNVRISQTLSGFPVPGHFGPLGFQTHQQHPLQHHLQVHQRAVEMAAHQRQHLQRLQQLQAGQDQTRQRQQQQPATNGEIGAPPPHVHLHHPLNADPTIAGAMPAGPVPALPGLPLQQAFVRHQLPGQSNPFQPPLQGIATAVPDSRGGGAAIAADQQRTMTPAQDHTQTNAQGNTAENVATNFADRMQQIQRELEQVTRRTQELSTQRLFVLGQMPSSVQQNEFQDGFRTMSDSLRRMQSTLDRLASDPAVANQPGFVPLRVLVGDWLLQTQAVESDISQWHGSNNGSPTANPTPDAALALEPSVTAAFAPAARATVGAATSIDNTSDNLMLLRDPSGQPHALLVGPGGTYRTPDISQEIMDRLFSQVIPPVNRNDSFSRFFRRSVGLPEGNHALGRAAPPELRRAPVNRVRAAGAHADQPQNNGPNAHAGGQQVAQPLNANAQIPRNNEHAARGLIGALVQPIWLLIRIVGMMYLFGGIGNGLSSWFQWRPLGIAMMMVAAYLLQQPWMRRRVDAVRLHFEQLFGVPLQRAGAAAQQPDQPRVEGQGAAQPAEAGTAAPDQAAVARATRAIAAAEGQGPRNEGSLRERLRSVERAVALFAASLVPGMGERIVEARQIADAEARRVAEEANAEPGNAQETALDQTPQAGDGQNGTSGDAQGEAQIPADALSADNAVGSSTQVDGAGSSELSRVNKGKEKALGDGETSISSGSA